MVNPFSSPGIPSDKPRRGSRITLAFVLVLLASNVLSAWLGVHIGYRIGFYDAGGTVHTDQSIPKQ